MGERVGWTGGFSGTFTSGGNEANFSALAIALTAKFPNSAAHGVRSIAGDPVLYASSEAHHSLDKSAGLLGIGRNAIRRIGEGLSVFGHKGKLGRLSLRFIIERARKLGQSVTVCT